MARISTGDKAAKNWLRKDEVFSRISAFCGLLLLAGLSNDICQYTFMENPLETTQSFTYITLVIHIISFFTSVLAFVYKTSRLKKRTEQISLMLIVCNGLLFLLRIILELTLINYRREYYNS
uniref:Uncharacterized protein n=1 Tax=Ciona savignyi TaxID=51511 RepID=H2Z942_CIOSA